MIGDTPKAFRPTSGCPTRKNTCLLRSGVDPIHNYMDYSFDSCTDEFTGGQIERMRTQWMEYRASGSVETDEILPVGGDALCPSKTTAARRLQT